MEEDVHRAGELAVAHADREMGLACVTELIAIQTSARRYSSLGDEHDVEGKELQQRRAGESSRLMWPWCCRPSRFCCKVDVLRDGSV